MKKYLENPLIRHSVYMFVAAGLILVVYLAFYAKPADLLWIEGESFVSTGPAWTPIEDVNFSGNRGIMSNREGAPAQAAFTVAGGREYTLWIKYFGNYGPRDMGLWRRAYTNNFDYIDHFGADTPLDISVTVDDRPARVVNESGPHRYRWARVGAYGLSGGEHTVKVWKTGAGHGSVTLDAAVLTPDADYAPGRVEAMPRQISEYLSPVLMISFPFIVWLYLRKDKAGAGPDRYYVIIYLVYSVLLGSVLSVMWIDTDGGFWIWLTQNREFTASSIYTSGDALHHRYVYPPPIALILIALRPVFTLFNAIGGITPLSILLAKAAVYPFIIGTGLLLHRLEGRGAVLLWALNSLVIFTVAAHSMYFGLAFIFTLCLYFLKKNRPYASALTLGMGLAYMSATMLLIPPFLLLLRSEKHPGRIVLLALLALLPGFLVFVPYQLHDPAGVNQRVMGAGISTWMSMHLGLRLGEIGLTSFLYAAGLAYLWIRRPVLDYENVSAIFALTGLVYLNIGAPFFLAWTVAFQPFLIVWAVRNARELFYSIYITALMIWGSFFMNTGGGLDRAGETGFFPYYLFYAWPFDVFQFLRIFYKKIDFFSPAHLVALTHSLSAGVSTILLVLIVSRLIKHGERVEYEYGA